MPSSGEGHTFESCRERRKRVCGGGGTAAGADGRWATSRMRPPRMPPFPRGLLWNGSDLIANPLTKASSLTRTRSWLAMDLTQGSTRDGRDRLGISKVET
jgi:hypothetical protein